MHRSQCQEDGLVGETGKRRLPSRLTIHISAPRVIIVIGAIAIGWFALTAHRGRPPGDVQVHADVIISFGEAHKDEVSVRVPGIHTERAPRAEACNAHARPSPDPRGDQDGADACFQRSAHTAITRGAAKPAS